MLRRHHWGRRRLHLGGRVSEGLAARPGTAEYDAFKKKQEAEADRDKSKDPPRPKASPPMKGTPQ